MNVQHVKLLYDREGYSKGTAFVTMGSAEEAQTACDLDGMEFIEPNRKLRINIAENRR